MGFNWRAAFAEALGAGGYMAGESAKRMYEAEERQKDREAQDRKEMAQLTRQMALEKFRGDIDAKNRDVDRQFSLEMYARKVGDEEKTYERRRADEIEDYKMRRADEVADLQTRIAADSQRDKGPRSTYGQFVQDYLANHPNATIEDADAAFGKGSREDGLTEKERVKMLSDARADYEESTGILGGDGQKLSFNEWLKSSRPEIYQYVVGGEPGGSGGVQGGEAVDVKSIAKEITSMGDADEANAKLVEYAKTLTSEERTALKKEIRALQASNPKEEEKGPAETERMKEYRMKKEEDARKKKEEEELEKKKYQEKVKAARGGLADWANR